MADLVAALQGVDWLVVATVVIALLVAIGGFGNAVTKAGETFRWPKVVAVGHILSAFGADGVKVVQALTGKLAPQKTPAKQQNDP